MDSDWQRRATIVLILFAALLFNYPLMSVADSLRDCCGVAVLPVYMFASWGAVIVVAALISIRGRR